MALGMALGDHVLQWSTTGLPPHLTPPHIHTPDPSTDPALAQELLDENQKEVQGTQAMVSPPHPLSLCRAPASSGQLRQQPHCSWLE